MRQNTFLLIFIFTICGCSMFVKDNVDDKPIKATDGKSIYFDRNIFFKFFKELKNGTKKIEFFEDSIKYTDSPMLDTIFYKFIFKNVFNYKEFDGKIDDSYYKIYAVCKFSIGNNTNAFIIGHPSMYSGIMFTLFSIDNDNNVINSYELADDVGDAGYCHLSKSILQKDNSIITLVRIIHNTDYSYMVVNAQPKDDILKGILNDSVILYSFDRGKIKLEKYISNQDSIKTKSGGYHSEIFENLNADSVSTANFKNYNLRNLKLDLN